MKCPKCKTENEKIRADYVGEDGNDGVDHFFECSSCGLKYETWYSRGSDGYTLSYDGKTEFVRGSDETPTRSPNYQSDSTGAWGKFESAPRKRLNYVPWERTSLPISLGHFPKVEDTALRNAFSYWVVLGLIITFALTILDPVNLPLAESLAGGALATTVILAVGLCLKSDGVLGCGVIAVIALLVTAGLRFVWVDWLTLLLWAAIWMASFLFATLFVRRLTVAIFVLLAAGFALGAWRWHRFTPPQLVLYNALDRDIVVSINGKEKLKLSPAGLLKRELSEHVELLTRLEDGTVIESVPIKPQKGLFPPHTLYNVKGRGTLTLHGSRGTEIYSRRLALRVETFAARGIELILPDQTEPSRSHWMKLVVVD